MNFLVIHNFDYSISLGCIKHYLKYVKLLLLSIKNLIEKTKLSAFKIGDQFYNKV
jgi:hypothetical protein